MTGAGQALASTDEHGGKDHGQAEIDRAALPTQNPKMRISKSGFVSFGAILRLKTRDSKLYYEAVQES
jgi:hypothetical protein